MKIFSSSSVITSFNPKCSSVSFSRFSHNNSRHDDVMWVCFVVSFEVDFYACINSSISFHSLSLLISAFIHIFNIIKTTTYKYRKNIFLVYLFFRVVARFVRSTFINKDTKNHHLSSCKSQVDVFVVVNANILLLISSMFPFHSFSFRFWYGW
jgi:hypothetical protein